jgi:hypothetical protein
MGPNRRSAMRVRDGRVQKKNNWERDHRRLLAPSRDAVRLERRRPAEGYRHLISIAQLRDFVTLLPRWDEVAGGLNVILLDSETDCDGWCGSGVVAVCPWQHDLWDWWGPEAVDEHRHLLDLLDVERVPVARSTEFAEFFEQIGKRAPASNWIELRWTEGQARAYQLLHILPHELGHHHDRMTSRAQRFAGRGEPYAESYANDVLAEIWPVYARRFGI